MTVRREKRRDRDTGAVYEFWMVDVDFTHPDGQRQRIRKVSPVQTRRGAEQYEREVRAALLDGTYGRKEIQVAFSEFAERFLSTYAAANNKPSEVNAKKCMLELHLKPFFEKKTLQAIGPEDIEAYKARKLEAGFSPKSIHNHLACLGRLFTIAVEWGVLEKAPIIKSIKVPKPEFDFFDFDEAKRLAEAAEGQLSVLVILALNTGLRIGEMRALRWEDVDLVAGRLMVRRSVWRADQIGTPKGGRDRELPLNKRTVQALKEHRHLRSLLVFCREDGSMLAETETYEPLAFACKRAGLRTVGWHVMRHTFASHLVMRGVPLKAVQELLGHSTIEMTMRYAHLSPDVRRDAVEALSAPVPRQSDGTGESALADSSDVVSS